MSAAFRSAFDDHAIVNMLAERHGADLAPLPQRHLGQVGFTEINLHLQVRGIGHRHQRGARSAGAAEGLRGHQLVRIHQFLQNHAVHRGANHAPVEVGLNDLPGPHQGLQLGLGGAEGKEGIIEQLLHFHLFSHEILGALQVHMGAFHRHLGDLNLTVHLRQLGAVFGVVEQHHHLAVGDAIALLHPDPFHHAHESRADLDALAVHDISAGREDRSGHPAHAAASLGGVQRVGGPGRREDGGAGTPGPVLRVAAGGHAGADGIGGAGNGEVDHHGGDHPNRPQQQPQAALRALLALRSDAELFQLVVGHRDFRAAITGRREARRAGRRLPAKPIAAEKRTPRSMRSGVTRN